MIIYLLALTTSHGRVIDIGPEAYVSEADAWAAADRVNAERRSRAKPARNYEVVRRYLCTSQ